MQSSQSGRVRCVASSRVSTVDGTSRYSTTATTEQVRSILPHAHHSLTTRADLGKVLAGIQVPPEDTEEFECFLKKLRYPYVEETNNPVVRKYLRT